MFSLEGLKKLALRIGIVGGLSTFVAMNSVPYILNIRIKESPHYKEAVQLLHSHPEAIKHLGEPIIEKRVNTSKEEDFGIKDNKLWFKIPVNGPKGSGKLFYECLGKKAGQDQHQLLNVELTVDRLKDYKLIIKKAE